MVSFSIRAQPGSKGAICFSIYCRLFCMVLRVLLLYMVYEYEGLQPRYGRWPYGRSIPESSGSKVSKLHPRGPPISNRNNLKCASQPKVPSNAFRGVRLLHDSRNLRSRKTRSQIFLEGVFGPRVAINTVQSQQFRGAV